MKSTSHSDTTCSICGSKKSDLHIEVPDRSSAGTMRSIARCSGCRTLMLVGQTVETQSDIKMPAFDPHHSSSKKRGLTELACAAVGPLTITWKRRLVSAHLQAPGPILEVGCGTGELASTLQNRGYSVVGVEPEENARQYAIRKHGLEVLAQLGEAKTGFRGAILWHVLEHVDEPTTFLEQLRSRMTADGIVVIAVPNAASLDASIYGADWTAWDAPRHKWHFERDSLDNVIRKAGFEIQNHKTVPSDTFFNCAASELHDPSASPWNLPFALFRSLWRSLRVIRSITKFEPDTASTLLVIAKVRNPVTARD